MKKIYTLLAILALSATSCVYPFEPEVEWSDQYYVVDGDILIGSYSTFKLTRSLSLNSPSYFPPQTASFSIESEDGKRYNYGGELGVVTADTRNLDPNVRYRLIVEVNNGVIIESDWLEPRNSGKLKDVEFEIDPITKSVVWFNVSSDNQDGENYYRWICHENWEYHSDYFAQYYYVPQHTSGRVVIPGEVLPFKGDDNIYWCWVENTSARILVGNTSDMSGSGFNKHKIYSIDCTDQRLSYIYSVEISQMAISEEAYRYWNTLDKNSDDVGGLFSPQPSECRGNLHIRGKNEMVLGYISAATISSKRIFYYDADHHFYKKKSNSMAEEDLPVFIQRSEWETYYQDGYLPTMPHYSDENPMLDPVAMGWYDWCRASCVDCRIAGGTKNKPSWWPNPHK